MKMKNLIKSKKADIWISAVIYVLVAVTAMVIILAATQPLIARMKDKAAFSKQKDTMTSLDDQISSVASEGAGSQRVVPVDISGGMIVVKDNGLSYSLETESKVVEPGSNVQLGHLSISSGSDVSAYQTNNSYILENSRVRFYFIKTNNLTDTGDIIQNVTLLSTNTNVNGGFEFDVGDGTSCNSGSFTSMQEKHNVGSASVMAHINQTHIYDLVFTLDTDADFVKVDVENLN
jgi:type II secretory pathway pseudopilin PulG